MSRWQDSTPGLVALPSGLRVRGRGRRRPHPGGQEATLTLNLTWRLPREADPQWWVRWPDFGVPLHRAVAIERLHAAYDRLPVERVEVTCGGGVGRTGTGLAALAVIDGTEPEEAIRLVRDTYHPRAVEMPWQRAFVGAVALRARRPPR